MEWEKKKEAVDGLDKQRRREREERQFGKSDRKELDKVVICWEDRRIRSVVRRREEIRRAALEEKACVKRAGKKLEEGADTTEGGRKGGGEGSRRQTGWQRRASVLTWRDGSESDSRPHLLPETEQWRIRCITVAALPWAHVTLSYRNYHHFKCKLYHRLTGSQTEINCFSAESAVLPCQRLWIKESQLRGLSLSCLQSRAWRFLLLFFGVRVRWTVFLVLWQCNYTKITIFIWACLLLVCENFDNWHI